MHKAIFSYQGKVIYYVKTYGNICIQLYAGKTRPVFIPLVFCFSTGSSLLEPYWHRVPGLMVMQKGERLCFTCLCWPIVVAVAVSAFDAFCVDSTTDLILCVTEKSCFGSGARLGFRTRPVGLWFRGFVGTTFGWPGVWGMKGSRNTEEEWNEYAGC